MSSKEMGVEFPAKLDSRNCIYVPRNIREFIDAEPGDYLTVLVTVARRTSRKKQRDNSPDGDAEGAKAKNKK